MTVGSLVGDTGVFSVVVIDASGIHEIPTTPDWTMNALQWETPATAVFDSQRAGQRHLFRLHLDDGTIDQLTSDPSQAEGQVSILPDGRLVHEAWSCSTGLYLGIQVTSPDGTQTVAITDPQVAADSGDDEQPAASPDGRSVAFVRQVGDGTGAIFSVPVDGGTPTRLTDDIAEIARPRWSPDGSTILYGVSGNLYSIPSSGGTPQQVTDCSGVYCWEGDWSPDGSQILYKRFVFDSDHVEVWIADADGSSPHALWVGDHSSAEQPDWGA
jgi:Tol biopolymer transport system component